MASTSNRPNANGLASVLQYITLLDQDDIEDLQSHTGPSVDVVLSDEELARLLFAQEASSLLNISKDYASGSSTEGRSLLEELTAMEEMARFDHEMAVALSEGRPLPTRGDLTPALGNTPVPVGVASEQASADATAEEELNTPEPDTPADSPSNATTDLPSPPENVIPIPLIDCAVCGEPIADTVVVMPCGHEVDNGCLQIMFRKAAEDESLFPPTCCRTELPLNDFRKYLSTELVTLYESKSLEFRTKNRVYCSRPSCSRFLTPAVDEPYSIECQVCRTRTCGACKEQAHIGRPCDRRDDSEVLGLAKKEGWQRCYSCRHLVELTQGCYHMICLCKAQFCYLCATPWRECTCPQFAEERL
ncbi:unnamed protein product [Somion occarium]|uniref:RBR-type E3 ubiquitin transferase n=1 Tax=Somion occarium TaxID=3059160 RepID=A0ABP1CLG6_9APHY